MADGLEQETAAWTALREAADRAGVAELLDGALAALVSVLRNLDRTQQETDESGGREVAWYYQRDGIENVLGLERGALDCGDDVEGYDGG